MAGLAEETPEGLRFRAEILSPDGKLAEAHDETLVLEGDQEAQVAAAARRGAAIADLLISRAAPELRQHITHA